MQFLRGFSFLLVATTLLLFTSNSAKADIGFSSEFESARGYITYQGGTSPLNGELSDLNPNYFSFGPYSGPYDFRFTTGPYIGTDSQGHLLFGPGGSITLIASVIQPSQSGPGTVIIPYNTLATGMVTDASLIVESNPMPGVPNYEGYVVSVDFVGVLDPQLQSLLHVSGSFTGFLAEDTGFQDNFLAPDGHGCGSCIDNAGLEILTTPEPASLLQFGTILAIILKALGTRRTKQIFSRY